MLADGESRGEEANGVSLSQELSDFNPAESVTMANRLTKMEGLSVSQLHEKSV